MDRFQTMAKNPSRVLGLRTPLPLRLLILLLPFSGAQSGTPRHLPVLTRAEEIRRLTPEQARLGYPVRLHAIVTFWMDSRPSQDIVYLVVQDSSAGIWVDSSFHTLPATLTVGQLIELEGVTAPGNFAPVVVRPRVTVLGRGAPKRQLRQSVGGA